MYQKILLLLIIMISQNAMALQSKVNKGRIIPHVHCSDQNNSTTITLKDFDKTFATLIILSKDNENSNENKKPQIINVTLIETQKSISLFSETGFACELNKQENNKLEGQCGIIASGQNNLITVSCSDQRSHLIIKQGRL